MTSDRLFTGGYSCDRCEKKMTEEEYDRLQGMCTECHIALGNIQKEENGVII